MNFQFTPNSCKLEEGGRKYEFPFDHCWDGNCHQVWTAPARPRLASAAARLELTWPGVPHRPKSTASARYSR